MSIQTDSIVGTCKRPYVPTIVESPTFNVKMVHGTFMLAVEQGGSMAYGDRKFGLPLFNIHAGAIFEMSMSRNLFLEVGDKLVIRAAMNNDGKRYRFGFIDL